MFIHTQLRATLLASLLISSLSLSAQWATLVNDSWSNANRSVQNLPHSSAWFGTSSDLLEAESGAMVGGVGESSRMWMTYFTNAQPQMLNNGESLRISVRFIPYGVNTGNSNRGLRIGLFNSVNGTRINEDGFSSGGANGNNVTGYLLNMNFANTWGMDNPLELRRRTQLGNANLMGGLAAFEDLLAAAGGTSGGQGFISGQTYDLVILVTRNQSSLNIEATFSNNSGWSSSVSATSDNAVLGFDTFAIRPDGESRTAESFRFLNFKVEYLDDPDSEEDPIEEFVNFWAEANIGQQDGFRSVGMGYIEDSLFPWVYHFDLPGWILLHEGSNLQSIRGYSFEWDGFHFWTREDLEDWIYIYDIGMWAQWTNLPIEELLDRDAPIPTPVDEIPVGLRTFYVSTTGSNSNSGTLEQPFATLNHAVSNSQAGDVIVIRGGQYNHSSTITIGTNRNGTANHPVHVVAFPGETPVFDFSGQSRGSGNIGIRLNANWWRLVGLTIRNAGHNGIRMDGSNNVLERLVAYGNHDTGIHMAGRASHNLVLNCDSYRNINYTGRVGNNADGFGAKFEDLGPGNRFYGCRAWENSDDGFDLWMAPHPIIIENCWAFGNGDGSVFGNPANFDGGGNGFKLGGNHVPGNHVVIRSIAFDNFGVSGNAKGFDHNNNTGALTLIHNTAFRNGRNFTFPNAPQSGGQHIFQNNLSVLGAVQVPNGSVLQGNSWQIQAASSNIFISIDAELAKSPRQPDGSLPDIDFLRPRPDSFVINAGVDIGMPFFGSAPDIGAYEYIPGN